MNMRNWLDGQMAPGRRKAMPILSFPAVQLMGITVRELISDADTQAQAMAMIARRCLTAAAVSMMDLSVEAECFGAEITVTDDEVPTVSNITVTGPEDAEKLVVPCAGARRAGLYVEAIAKARRLITDRPVFAGVIGPYSLAGRLMGMTNIMMSCYEEPETVHTVLEKAAEFITNYILEYKKAGAHGVVMAEPAAGLISADLAEEFSCRYIKKIVEAVQNDDFILIYHNCGSSVRFMVPQLLDIGAAAYHFGNAVEMAEMLKKMPGDILIMGNVDPTGVLRLGTPESVRTETLRIMNACSGYGNFLISSGCDIPPMTPWENIDAFFAAVDEFYER